MPNNNSAIPPSDEITGSATLPLSRVKRILQVDEDIIQCSNNAAFVVTIATEMFVRHLAEQAHNVVKSERKPRKTVQYKDVANAVARIDNLEFLSDVIPRTQTYRQYKEKKAREAAIEASVEPGQTTLDGRRPTAVPNGRTDGSSEIEANGAEHDLDVAEVQAPRRGTKKSQTNGQLIFKHYHANGTGARNDNEDVDME